MTSSIFALDIVVTFALCIVILREYGNIRRSLFVSLITVLTWFFSFSIVLIVPMDISSTFYWDCVRTWYCKQYTTNESIPLGCEHDVPLTNETALTLCAHNSSCSCEQPWSYDFSNPIPEFWKVVYWSLQMLTWVILPHVGSYLTAGDFSFWGKLKTSLKENAIINFSLAILVIALLVYMVVAQHITKEALGQIAIGAANTWGLIMVMLMFGFGLVDIPRYLWRMYDLNLTLKLYQYQAAKQSIEMAEAQEKLDEVYEEVRSVAGRMPKEDPLRKYVSVILLKCPFGSTQESYTDFKNGEEKPITLKSLASLHTRLINRQRTLHRCECLWDRLMEKSFGVEDCINQANDPERSFTYSFRTPYKGMFKKIYPKVLWWWKVKISPYLFLLMAAICTLLSIALIWSEVLFFFERPQLSIFALLLEKAHGQYLYIELLSFVTIFYMSICTYRVVFKMRIFNFYFIAPHQMTDSYSLIFSAMLLSRLTVPITLNFVSMAHLDTHVTTNNVIQQDMWFTQTMGHLDLLPWLKQFNTYYPTVILIVSICTLFSLGNRFLLLFGVQRFIDDDDGAQELATEGKALIRRERRKMEKNGGTLANHRSPMAARRTGSAAAAGVRGGRIDDEDEEEGRGGYTRTKGALAGTKGAFGGKSTAAASSTSGSKGGKATTAAASSASSDSSSSTKQSTTSYTKAKKADKPSFSLSSLGKLFNNKEDDDEATLLPTSAVEAAPKKSYLGRNKKAGPPRNVFDDL